MDLHSPIKGAAFRTLTAAKHRPISDHFSQSDSGMGRVAEIMGNQSGSQADAYGHLIAANDVSFIAPFRPHNKR